MPYDHRSILGIIWRQAANAFAAPAPSGVEDFRIREIVERSPIMFRKMRRFKQMLPEERCIEILKEAPRGVLALLGDDDYPYTVPLDHFYEDGKLYFHCAKEGYKVDLMKADPHVAFTVVAQDDIIPEDFNTLFLSVMAFGKVRLVDDPVEMREIHGYIIEKYSKGHEENGAKYLDSSIADIYMAEIRIDHITGKKGV